jgi:hypothetical protein
VKEIRFHVVICLTGHPVGKGWRPDLKVAPCTDDADDDNYEDDDDNGDDDDDGDDCVSTRDARENAGAWIDVHARAMREVRVDRDWEDAFAKLGAGDSVEDLLFVVLCNIFAHSGWTAQLARSWFAAIFFSI